MTPETSPQVHKEGTVRLPVGSAGMKRLVEQAVNIATMSRRLNGTGLLGFRYLIESVNGNVALGEFDGDELRRPYGVERACSELTSELHERAAARYVVFTNCAMETNPSAVPGVLIVGCEPGRKATAWVFDDVAFAAPVLKPLASMSLPMSAWFTDLFDAPAPRGERDTVKLWETVCSDAGKASDLMEAAKEYMRSTVKDTKNKHAVIFRGKWWNGDGIYCIRFSDALYAQAGADSRALEVLEMSLVGAGAAAAVLVERSAHRAGLAASRGYDWGDEFVLSTISRNAAPRKADFKVIQSGGVDLVTVYDDGGPVWKSQAELMSPLCTVLAEALKPDYVPEIDASERMALTAGADGVMRELGMSLSLVWSTADTEGELITEAVH